MRILVPYGVLFGLRAAIFMNSFLRPNKLRRLQADERIRPSYYFYSTLCIAFNLARLLNFCRLAWDVITPEATANFQSFPRGLGGHWVRVLLRGGCVLWVVLNCDYRATLWPDPSVVL